MKAWAALLGTFVGTLGLMLAWCAVDVPAATFGFVWTAVAGGLAVAQRDSTYVTGGRTTVPNLARPTDRPPPQRSPGR